MDAPRLGRRFPNTAIDVRCSRTFEHVPGRLLHPQGHARGLMYLEMHLRTLVKYELGKKPDVDKYKQTLQTELGFLQELYAAIEDSDGTLACLVVAKIQLIQTSSLSWICLVVILEYVYAPFNCF